jgi:hypothetical protein
VLYHVLEKSAERNVQNIQTTAHFDHEGLQMKKILHEEELFCNQCKCAMDFQTIHIEFGYGHNLDGEQYDFCSDTCFVEWLKFNNVIEKD